MHYRVPLLAAALAALVWSPAIAGPTRVTILHTNDWQSGLTGVGPDCAYTPDVVGDDETIGGVARLATLIDLLRDKRRAEGPVLLLDGGDVTMGTLYHTVTRETGSELQLMHLLGYDAVTPGNHEFDFRPKGFGQMVASASAAEGLPPLVATNLDLSSEHPDLAVIESLYARGILERTRIIERGGVKIGLAGILGVDANEKMEAGTPVKIAPPIAAAQRAVDELRGKGAELVVVLSHSGVVRKEGAWIGEEVDLMHAVPGIDVIVGGHSHTALHEPIVIDGRPILQAGSDTQWLGELVIERTGTRWKVVEYELHALDDRVRGRDDITARVNLIKAEVDARVLTPLGYQFDQVVAKVSGQSTSRRAAISTARGATTSAPSSPSSCSPSPMRSSPSSGSASPASPRSSSPPTTSTRPSPSPIARWTASSAMETSRTRPGASTPSARSHARSRKPMRPRYATEKPSRCSSRLDPAKSTSFASTSVTSSSRTTTTPLHAGNSRPDSTAGRASARPSTSPSPDRRSSPAAPG